MTAKKFDAGKPRLSLIPVAAMDSEAAVLAFGAEKYGLNNWRNGMAWSRLIDASLRHIYAFSNGEDNDPETGITHLAHARCCLGFLMDYLESHPEFDDRMKDKSDNKTIDMFDKQVPLNLPRPKKKGQWRTEPSCYDSAMERQAIENGSVFKLTFPENAPEHRIG